MQTTPCFFGIDVASQWLDIYDGKTDKPLRITNTLTAISRWLDTLPPHALIALEVTGSYHLLLATAAHTAGFTVFVINPRELKHYAKGIGRRAKSDAIDAKIIYRYLKHEYQELRPWHPASPEQQRLNMLFQRRAGIIKHRQAIQMACKELETESLSQALLGLKVLIDELEAQIFQLVKHDGENYQKYLALLSIPGIGKLTAAYLSNLFARADFNHIDQVISFLGLDLVFQDSGMKHGKRHISKRGPGEARRLLFNAARAAARSDLQPLYDSYAQRMCHSKAIIAVMKKLVKIAFGIWKSAKPFDIKLYQSPLLAK